MLINDLNVTEELNSLPAHPLHISHRAEGTGDIEMPSVRRTNSKMLAQQ